MNQNSLLLNTAAGAKETGLSPNAAAAVIQTCTLPKQTTTVVQGEKPAKQWGKKKDVAEAREEKNSEVNRLRKTTAY